MQNRPPDQFILTKGQRIRYWELGSSGPTVLLLHGLSCSVVEWERNIGELASQHRVIALDLLGCGLSDKPLDVAYDMLSQARLVFDFMDALGLPSAHLVGNSMGARIAMECAAMQPDRVRALVLAAPAGIGRSTLFGFRLTAVPVLGELLSLPNLFSLKTMWKLAFHDPSFVTKQMLTEKLALSKQVNAKSAFLATSRSFIGFGGFLEAERRAFLARISKIRCPALVIWGRQDRYLPVSHVDILEPLLPQAQVELFERCGHVPMVETAARFNHSVLAFLQQHG